MSQLMRGVQRATVGWRQWSRPDGRWVPVVGGRERLFRGDSGHSKRRT